MYTYKSSLKVLGIHKKRAVLGIPKTCCALLKVTSAHFENLCVSLLLLELSFSKVTHVTDLPSHAVCVAYFTSRHTAASSSSSYSHFYVGSMYDVCIYMLKGMFYLEVFICVRSMLRILYSVPFVLQCIHVTCGGTIRHRAFIS